MADNNETKTDWERGKDALEIILQFVSVEKIEALASKMQSNQVFRQQAKLFLNSLK